MALTEKRMTDRKSGFELADLRDEKLHMVCLKGSECHGIDARNTSWEHANFVDSRWKHIYFANVHVDMIQMGGTIFERIMRPDADRSQLNEEPGTDGWINVEPVQFRNSDLSAAIFAACDLSGVQLNRCKIDGLVVDGIPIKELLDAYKAKRKEPAPIAAFRQLRQETLEFAANVPAELIDVVPEGFNNSIRWNLGHILVAWDHAIFPKLGEPWRVPTAYHYTFPRGTSPRSWTVAPPDFAEIVDRLHAQQEAIAIATRHKLDAALAEPFLRIRTIRGMYKFMLREEAHHLQHMKKIAAAATIQEG